MKQTLPEKLSQKVWIIAKYLGCSDSVKNESNDRTEIYTFDSERFAITSSNGEISFSDIYYSNKSVFTERDGKVDCYAPGPWEAELNQLYVSALERQKSILEKHDQLLDYQKRQKEKELRKRKLW